MGEKIIFFAYKGKNEGTNDDNIESIKYAVKEYNQYQKTYVAKLWEDYRQTTCISADILNAINECEIFVCDLTYFNHNVLFELGYAIAKNKNILILLNNNIDDAGNKYRDFFLKGVRYTSLDNSKNILTAIQQKNYESDLLGKYIKIGNLEKNSLDLLYIKSKLKNQASINLSDKIQFLKETHELSVLVDDPSEVAYRPESWYFGSIYKAKSVIIHFWGENTKDAFNENAQNSLLAGLAVGLERKIILVAPSKFRAPLDYYEILTQYDSSEELITHVNNWLGKHLINEQIEKKIEKIEEHQSNLIKLGIGCEVAEYEKDGLLQYFVETSPYRSALVKEKIIVVGRKGSGKTAIYIKLLDELSKRSLNYILNIKPESNELLEDAELGGVFRNKSTQRSFFIAAWKLTIFSKLIYSIYEKLNQSLYADFSRTEKDLIVFVKRHEQFMNMNIFGVILEINKKIKSQEFDINSPRVLDELYKEYLSELTNILKNYFRSINTKYFKIIIIADNLDKAWDIKGELNIQSELIASLLEIDNKIKSELINKNDNQVDFQTIIFLREDIFRYILRMVNEPDKLTLMHNEINWEDYPELLKKVIENRFKYSLNLGANEDMDKIWSEYFEIKKNRNPFEVIKSIVTPRPRDFIYFVSQLFESAINRGGEKVTDSDLDRAIMNYTNFLNENLIAETKAEYPEVDKILAKLQEYYGEKIEYKTFSKILDEFGFNQNKKKKFTKVLFESGYMLGFDNVTNQPFADIDILERKLNEKKWLVFPRKVYVIAHAKYYKIKNIVNKPF
jgi:Cdc6-like AAA superfamily ATPase